jgi:hypothetical protein
VAANNFSNILRRLDRLEAQVGDGDEENWGPALLVTFTRYWGGRSTIAADAGDDQDEDATATGRWQEQAAITAAVDQLREEARKRGQPLGIVHARIADDGVVRFAGVPWQEDDPDMAWTSRHRRW